MFWIPIVIGGAAIGAAVGAAFDKKEAEKKRKATEKVERKVERMNNRQTRRQTSTHQRRPSAGTRQHTHNERVRRTLRYRKRRNQQVNAFLATHKLSAGISEMDERLPNPDNLLGKVRKAVADGVNEIEKPLRDIDKDIEKLSAIRDDLVSIIEAPGA